MGCFGETPCNGEEDGEFLALVSLLGILTFLMLSEIVEEMLLILKVTKLLSSLSAHSTSKSKLIKILHRNFLPKLLMTLIDVPHLWPVISETIAVPHTAGNVRIIKFNEQVSLFRHNMSESFSSSVSVLPTSHLIYCSHFSNFVPLK